MCVAATCNQDSFFVSESQVLKAQCKQDLHTCTAVADGISKEYKKLGEAYHELPYFIRRHEWVPPEWREYCQTAFTVEETREIPDMLQILNILSGESNRVRAAINCEDVGIAQDRLNIMCLLLNEAWTRMSVLSYAIGVFEDVLQTIQDQRAEYPEYASRKVNGWCDGVALSNRLEAQWRKALPENLRSLSRFNRNRKCAANEFADEHAETESLESRSLAIHSPRISNADSGVGLEDEE